MGWVYAVKKRLVMGGGGIRYGLGVIRIKTRPAGRARRESGIGRECCLSVKRIKESLAVDSPLWQQPGNAHMHPLETA